MRAGLLALAALLLIPLAISGCTPGAEPAPTAAAIATQVAPTTAALATQVAPTVATIATQVAPTAAAVATQAAPAVATAAAPIATAVAPLATPVTKAATTTAGELADQGRAVFANNCAGCHGAQGQGGRGPTLIGQKVTFPRFDTGEDLLEYVTERMPANHPGSLSAEQYLQVTAFLLVENDFVQPGDTLTNRVLDELELTR